MLQKFKWSWVFTTLTFIAGLVSYFQITPDVEIPIHWDKNGDVDNTVRPLIALFIIPVSQVLVLVFFSALNFIEPRRKNIEKSIPAIRAMLTGIIIVVGLAQAMIISEVFGYHIMGPQTIFATMGLLFIITGNYLTKLRSGFFIGIRTPWTLSSDYVWKKSHRIGGRLLMLAGFIILGAGFFYSGKLMSFIILATIIPATFIPMIYSWFIWRRENEEKNLKQS